MCPGSRISESRLVAFRLSFQPGVLLLNHALVQLLEEGRGRAGRRVDPGQQKVGQRPGAGLEDLHQPAEAPPRDQHHQDAYRQPDHDRQERRQGALKDQAGQQKDQVGTQRPPVTFCVRA
jgi:hypothetical protein